MTAEEKERIYHLLHTGASWALGYDAPGYGMLAFTDDVAAVAAPAPEVAETQEAPGGSPKASAAPLAAIAEKVAACRNCVLHERRAHTVPGEGVEHPVVMVIGEGPGEDEDRTGRPFVGRAGQLLDKMLSAIQLDRSCNCYIANIVKCRPPANRTPRPEEAEACSGYLQAQIHILRPRLILAMGRTAVQNLLQTAQGINALRGKFFPYSDTIPLLATYHPSALLRNEELKRPAWEDLKIFKARLLELCPDYAAPFLARHPQGTR